MQKENKKNIILMLLITFFQGIVIYSTIATLYRQQRGLSLSDFAIIEGFSYVFTLAFEIPFGFIADRIGYKKTLVISNMIYFLSKIVFWKANGFVMFLLERFLLSIAIAGLSGVDVSILFLSSDQDKSQKTFSYYNAVGNAGLFLSSILFTSFFYQSYDGCAIGTVITYGIAAILSLFIDEVKGKDESQEKITVSNLKEIFKTTLKDTKFLLFILASALLSSSCWTVVVMLNQPKYISLGLTERHIGILHIIFGIFGLFTVSSAFFTKKVGFKNFLFICSGLLGVFAIWMGYTQFALIAILANLICDLGYSMMVPLINDLQNKRVTVSDRATQLSVYAMIGDIFAFILNYALSLVANISNEAMFIFSGLEAFLAILLIQMCYRKENIEE